MEAFETSTQDKLTLYSVSQWVQALLVLWFVHNQISSDKFITWRKELEQEINLSPGQIMMPRIPTVAIGRKPILSWLSSWIKYSEASSIWAVTGHFYFRIALYSPIICTGTQSIIPSFMISQQLQRAWRMINLRPVKRSWLLNNLKLLKLKCGLWRQRAFIVGYQLTEAS